MNHNRAEIKLDHRKIVYDRGAMNPDHAEIKFDRVMVNLYDAR